MENLARRVWPVTLAAFVLFVAYETIKTLMFPRMSVVVSHVVTVVVVALLTFVVSRYALSRYGAALAEIERQTQMSEATNRLLTGVLATMREGVLIEWTDSNTSNTTFEGTARELMRNREDALHGCRRMFETRRAGVAYEPM